MAVLGAGGGRWRSAVVAVEGAVHAAVAMPVAVPVSVSDCGQNVAALHHLCRRSLSLLAGAGHHHRHGLAHTGQGVAGQQRELFLAQQGQQRVEGGHMVLAQLSRSEHRHHTRHALGRLCVQPQQTRVGMGAAHEGQVPRSGQRHVLPKAGQTPQQGVVFAARGLSAQGGGGC